MTMFKYLSEKWDDFLVGYYERNYDDMGVSLLQDKPIKRGFDQKNDDDRDRDRDRDRRHYYFKKQSDRITDYLIMGWPG